MKKLALLIAFLVIATPAMAVDISITDAGDGWAEISYDASGEAELPRAFGLDITASDANITEVDVAGAEPFGVYPGTIEITDGIVDSNGTPVAPSDDPGALGGLGTSGITIEMGSLYAAGATAPATESAPAASGLLIMVKVDGNTDLTVEANEERAATGVVLEDSSDATTNLPATQAIELEVECFDSAHEDYDKWVAVGKPESWCYKYQCYGDADGQQNGGFGNVYRVGTPDLNVLISGWKDQNYEDPSTDAWIAADFDRTENGGFGNTYRVGTPDLNILIANWKDDSGIDMDNPDCGGNL